MPSQDALDIHQKTLLSDVTLSALQLIQQPFGPAAPDTETFSDDISLEQLGDVKQALVSGDDLLLILGESGSGKSVLLHELGINSGQSIQCFAVKGSPRFSTLNLFAGMLEAFKHKPPENLKEILDELAPCLQTMVSRNTLSAIVLDDADQISETELTQLLSSMLYINSNSQDETLMRVALAAPPEFEDRIPDLLPEGADLPYSSLTIEGMDSDRAAEYLSFRLQQAGFNGELPFSDQDVDDIVGQSGGLPSGLHVAAADVLNQIFDPMQHPPLEELESARRQPLLQSRNAKLALGALAVLLIAGGLLMFTPDAADDQDRYADNTGTTNAVPTSSLGSSVGSDPTADSGNTATGSTDRSDEPGSEIDDDASELRVIDERKVVPFTSDAIESLVPKPNPSSTASTTSADTDSTTSNTGDPGTDTTEIDVADSAAIDSASDLASESASTSASESATSTVSESASVSASNSASNSATPASSSNSTLEATPSADASAGSPPEDELPAGTPAGNLSDDDLLPDALPSTQDELAQTVAENVSGAATEATSGSTPASLPAGNTGDGAATATPPVIDSDTPDVDPELAGILESPTWILVQDSSKITVQMSASRDRPSIESFLKRNSNVLPAPNSIYTFQRRGETWYALLHGLYDTFEDAQNAVEQMPDSAVTDQPWIRNVGRVQDVLKAQ